MPGIAGIVGRAPTDRNRRDVDAMLAGMRHDPAYACKIFVSPDCGACVGVLSHRDSYADNCSAGFADGLALALAGECFPSSVDGSAGGGPAGILDRYRRQGLSFVGELNGLFSGVLIDARRRHVLLFNDRYGAERIYVYRTDESLYFASEAKALLSVVPALRALDDEGVAQYLTFGSTRDGRTLFRGLRLLPGGSLWTMEPGRPPVRQTYFEPSEWESQSTLGEDAFETEFVDTARAVIPRYARAESALGISITGGLDTRMIMACLPESRSNVVCYTYGAADSDTLDVRIGRRVAKGTGLDHHTLRVDDDFVSGFPEHLDRTVFITDGCLGALGAHEVYLSAKARQLAPVRLTGNFGSEVLRSMSTLKPLGLHAELLSPEIAERVRAWRDAPRSAHPLTRTAFDEIPLHLFGPLAAARSQLTFRTPYLDNALVGLAYRAPPGARRSPTPSLRLIATGETILGRIPTDRGYSCGRPSPLSALRRIHAELTFKLDYLDKEGLPPQFAVFDRLRGPLSRLGLLGLHKFLPYRRWFRNELADYAADVLQSATVRQQPWWSPAFLDTMGADHARGRANYLREINAVLTLDAVDRLLVRGLPSKPADGAEAEEFTVR